MNTIKKLLLLKKLFTFWVFTRFLVLFGTQITQIQQMTADFEGDCGSSPQ